MAEEISVWGEGTEGLWSFGKSITIPDGYVEFETGDAYLTRKVKQMANRVFIRMKRHKRLKVSRPVGILAPADVVVAAREEAAQTAEARQKKRAAGAASRQRKEAKTRNTVKQRMLELYPMMPSDEAEEITEHAFEVGSGRVGRSSMVELDGKIELAVRAHVRHSHTDYDRLMDEGWDREDARDEVRSEIGKVIEKWRGLEADDITSCGYAPSSGVKM